MGRIVTGDGGRLLVPCYAATFTIFYERFWLVSQLIRSSLIANHMTSWRLLRPNWISLFRNELPLAWAEDCGTREVVSDFALAMPVRRSGQMVR